MYRHTHTHYTFDHVHIIYALHLQDTADRVKISDSFVIAITRWCCKLWVHL